ncbi:hypothetical protein ACP275_06G073200 [Erythranthe tilingii]
MHRTKKKYIGDMEASRVRCYSCVVFVFVLVGIFTSNGANAAGECPKSTPDMEAMKLIPCASAVQDSSAAVSGGCCAQVKKIGQNPRCLCAVLLSNMAKAAGVKPEIAITIPKRCNLSDRPVGYKCGAYTLP